MYEVLIICTTILLLAIVASLAYYTTTIGKERVRQSAYARRSSGRNSSEPRPDGILGVISDIMPLLQDPAVRKIIMDHLQPQPPAEQPSALSGVMWANGSSLFPPNK